jgi:hypothetical protein
VLLVQPLPAQSSVVMTIPKNKIDYIGQGLLGTPSYIASSISASATVSSNLISVGLSGQATPINVVSVTFQYGRTTD